MALLWPAEDSRWTFGDGFIWLREASGVGGENIERIAQGLECEVLGAPPGAVPVDGMPSLTT